MLESLHANPREHLVDWLEELGTHARALCASLSPHGALGLASTLVVWTAVNGGDATRPNHVMPAALPNDANPATRAIFADEVLLYRSFSDAKATLRKLALESIGEVNKDTIRVAITGLHGQTANSVIAAMVLLHGTYTEDDVTMFLKTLEARLTSVSDFDKHVATFRRTVAKLALAGVTTGDYTSYRTFLLTISTFPAFGTHIDACVTANRALGARSFAGLATFLRPHLPSIATLSGRNPFAGNITAQQARDYLSSLYDAEKQTHPPPVGVHGAQGMSRDQLRHNIASQQRLLATMESSSGGTNPRQNQRRNQFGSLEDPTPGRPPRPTATETPAGMYYCYHHGHNRTHGWFQGSAHGGDCKFMVANPTRFSAAQRAAKTCDEVAGGSKFLQKVSPPSLALPTPVQPLTPPSSNTNSKPSSKTRKPEYDNPFAAMTDPLPLPPPDHPRDSVGKPLAQPLPFIPPHASPSYTNTYL